jgi:hypothetical protein
MMDGPDSGASLAGGEEIYDRVLVLKTGDVLEEFGGLRDGEWLKMFCLEETEEGTVPIGEVFDEPLGGGDDGEAGVFLDEGSQLFLSGIAEPLEDGVEVFGHDQECARTESREEMLRDEFQGGVLFEVIRGTEHVCVEFSWVALLQSRVDLQKKLEEGRAGFVFIQPCDAQMVCERLVFSESADDERDEVGFPTAARTHEEEVVLVVCQRAFLHPLDGVPQEALPLDENELEVLRVGAAGGEDPDGFAAVGTLCGV